LDFWQCQLAGVNQNGSDDKGYDITYNNGVKTYKVEVKKTSSDNISFFISESEIRFAQQPENKDDYEIRCVILDGNTAKIKRLCNIFSFSDGEDLHNNSMFTIQCKQNYKVIAKELVDKYTHSD